jgi:hypothetical protein
MDPHDPSIRRVPDPFAIRPAVRERVAQQGRRIAFNRALPAHNACDAAHVG